MTKHLHLSFALLLVFVVTACVLTACKDKPITCGVPGSVQTCDCSDGRTGGSQTCREGDWTECACTGEIPEVDGGTDGAVDSGAGTDGGADASNNTDGGADTDAGAGTGGASGSGGTGGAGGTGGTSGTGGTGGTSGTGGTGGTGGTFPAAYTGPCTMNSDCGPDALCLKNASMLDSHCAPKCVTATTCPAPGSGTAILECSMPTMGTEKACRLPCFGALCPTGLTCDGIVPILSYCY